MKSHADAKKAAANLYSASRELAMPAKQHELMGTSHDLLQEYIMEAETKLQENDQQIQSLKNVVRELEKMQPAGRPVAATPEGGKP